MVSPEPRNQAAELSMVSPEPKKSNETETIIN